MANERNQKKSALLDWQNEKKYQESVVKSGKASAADVAYAKSRIKEADRQIAKLKK